MINFQKFPVKCDWLNLGKRQEKMEQKSQKWKQNMKVQKGEETLQKTGKGGTETDVQNWTERTQKWREF